MKNPVDNWGEVGFKLKTYEEVPGAPADPKDPNSKPGEAEEFLVDMLEGNELLPALPCEQPC
jgi:hypothetical protein